MQGGTQYTEKEFCISFSPNTRSCNKERTLEASDLMRHQKTLPTDPRGQRKHRLSVATCTQNTQVSLPWPQSQASRSPQTSPGCPLPPAPRTYWPLCPLTLLLPLVYCLFSAYRPTFQTSSNLDPISSCLHPRLLGIACCLCTGPLGTSCDTCRALLLYLGHFFGSHREEALSDRASGLDPCSASTRPSTPWVASTELG